ncbi:MAG TPA: TonB-dependent receptor [Gemmatimonadales bacterium]|nr:TonB-dependent receptor [Gemmatimonadales bacterium]
MRHTTISTLTAIPIAIGLLGIASAAPAQGGTGVLVGAVHDSTNVAISGARVDVLGTAAGVVTSADGSFRLLNIPAGVRTVVVHRLGFAPDSALVEILAGGSAVHNFVLAPAAVRLASIVVRASPRMAETKAGALAVEQNATNIVSALSGDEIRSLPNFNAAEAAGRIPGVSLERDEGEGKFVQVRGTEPRLSNVTINGAHIPGTEAARVPKLDDVPSDLLAAIEVSKTLTADMEADAIGGSVNLVTKTAEGAPRGYVAGQYGQIALGGRNTYQGGFAYGGRFSQEGRLGLLVGGSADRNNRAIDDLEPAWGVYSGVAAPNEWSMRDYRYGRERFGMGGNLDYRFDANNQLYLKGLWSLFRNDGTDYIYDIAGDATPGAAGTGTIPGASLTRTTNTRTPKEQMWAATAGARHTVGVWTLDYALNVAGTRQRSQGYRFSNFTYAGPALTIGYSAPDGTTYPRLQYQSATDSQAAADPANYTLGTFFQGDRRTSGRDVGGAVNARLDYGLGGYASKLQFGARYRDEHKAFTSQSGFFIDTAATPPMTQFANSFSDPDYYTALASGYAIGPVANAAAVIAYENTHAGNFRNVISAASDSLGSFGGSERITAGYVMNTTDVGALQVNVGLRVEATHASYAGHSLSTPTDSAGTPTGPDVLQPVSGTKAYTDLFPSVQLRYAVDPETNIRLAVTRGISRPNYPDLAPNQSGNTCATCANQPSLSGFTTGNPNLKAQYAWNYDLLAAHYLTTVGVISGGVFYKSLRDVILTRQLTYTGPGPFNGYVGYAPENGGSGRLFGFEATWTQRFVFLPGWLAGFGIDANYTHTSSKVLVDPVSGRQAPLLRQAPNIANVYATYDKWPFSARLGWTFNGAMIAYYGDGTPTPSGDTYFYQHGQFDGSIVYNATPDVQIQAQVLNINNAVFGFYKGTPDHRYNIQREYYRQTFFLGTKIGF